MRKQKIISFYNMFGGITVFNFEHVLGQRRVNELSKDLDWGYDTTVFGDNDEVAKYCIWFDDPVSHNGQNGHPRLSGIKEDIWKFCWNTFEINVQFSEVSHATGMSLEKF